MTKFKQVEFSRKTARRNPKMILREYDKLIDEQEQKKQRLAKAIDKVSIDAGFLFENSDMEHGAEKMINELRTLFDIKFEADRTQSALRTRHTLIDVYVPALEAMLNAANEKTVNLNHVAYRDAIRNLKLLKEERREFFNKYM